MSLAFQNWGSTIFWLHHFFKPLLSFVPIFIIYTPMLFLFPFVLGCSLICQTPLIVFIYLFISFICDFAVCFQDAEWYKSWNDAFDKTFNSATKTQTRVHTVITGHLSYMFMLDRWWLHVNGCSMYIWSNCSCRFCTFFYLIFVMLNNFLMLSYVDKGMVCDLCKGSFVSYVKYDLIIHPNQ